MSEKKLLSFCASLLVVLCVGEGSASSLTKAGARIYRILAAQGNADGLYNHGRVLELGLCGEKKDPVKAAKCYEEAARKGHPEGQCDYGRCLECGIGVPVNPPEAARYYKLAADQGNSNG